MSELKALLVKVCGITCLEDARDSVEAGATHLGFVFANSPRKVDAAQVQSILTALPRSFAAVGVFKEMATDQIVELVTTCRLDIAQLHGEYKAADLEEIRRRGGKPVMLAVVPNGELWEEGIELARLSAVDMLLLDARGDHFDWRRTAEANALGKPVFLAGGLTPGIVGLAVAMAQPGGVDVASGVESAPGRKDPALVRSFIAEARNAGTGGPQASTAEFAPRGRFGAYANPFGGAYVPETLVAALEELEHTFSTAQADPAFHAELKLLLANYAGRPTPLHFAARLSELYGASIWLKREDLLHTGAHKLNNCLGQALLARRMGKRRVVAETGAGQHGVGTATVCALLGLESVVYMGAEDMERQEPNVHRMNLLGAEVRAVTAGTRTLKDATSEAIRDWVANVAGTYYLIGSTVGPHPYPLIVREFQRVIGIEARQQMLAQAGRLPDIVAACVGGGSNALGAFYEFLYDSTVELHGVEAAGEGLDARHAATLSRGRPGVLHGTYSYLLQAPDGQVAPVHSISAGLDYPGVGPEHSFLRSVGRADYFAVTDAEALAAFNDLARSEGILAALESCHALAHARHLAAERPGALILVNLSGRGDKDLDIVMRAQGQSQ